MLTAERLKELLDYDPGSGVFTWKVARRGQYARPGVAAGTRHINGYMCIGVDRRRYLAHRLAWLYMTGEWPRDEVDHRNLDRLDNRWVNLRAANHDENSRNTRIRRNNTTGLKGVSHYHDGPRSFRARIFVKGKEHHLGLFATAEEAHEAYCKASANLHGEFGRAS